MPRLPALPAPAQAVAVDEDDPVQNPTVIHPGLAVAFGKIGAPAEPSVLRSRHARLFGIDKLPPAKGVFFSCVASWTKLCKAVRSPGILGSFPL